MSYKVLLYEEQYAQIYRRMNEEGLLWAAYPEIDAEEWSEEGYIRMMARDDVLCLAGYIDNEIGGVMTLYPAVSKTRTAVIGLTAFRDYFRQAVPLCMGALLWACATQDIESILGRVAAPNRHILRLLNSLGFEEKLRVPGMTWYTKKQKFVDGVIVMATPDTIREAAKTVTVPLDTDQIVR